MCKIVQWLVCQVLRRSADPFASYSRKTRGGAITRALERGQILPSPHVFCEYLSKYSFGRRDFFNTCQKINGAPFGAKIEDSPIFRSIFKPQVSTSVFRRADAMTGVSWRPPPPAPAGWAALRRPVARGRPGAGVPAGRWGGAAERLGGGGARSRSRIAGSGGRRAFVRRPPAG